MDHRQALETQAAERYLLGELPAEENEAFELHFFECAICAAAVESGQLFVRAAVAEKFVPGAPEETRASFWESIAAVLRQPALALTAMTLLAAAVFYQNLYEIPGLRRTLSEARPLPAFQLIGISRGEDPQVKVPAGAPFVSLAADIPPDAHFKRYVCVIAGGGGTVFRVSNPAPDAGHPITILVPTTALKAGRHELTIYGEGADGQPADKISNYPFDFQIN